MKFCNKVGVKVDNMKKVKEAVLSYEIANSISHGFGLLFGIVAMPVLISLAVVKGDTALIVGTAIYGFSFLMVYAFSTLYHSAYNAKVKQVMRVMDHISIYFLIAGSYTPFILAFVFNVKGIIILTVVWTLALLGIFFKAFFIGRFKILSVGVYLLMGWMAVLMGKSMLLSMPTSVLILIAIGGILYSAGVVFYLWKRLNYNHMIWHLFVLAASVCHYVAVLLTIIN